ncbi:MAG: dehydrogenase E1 component subunit alpha/beta [Bacteroidetes bacterium]|nr:dehydrogenase E1 component subunit alpha/beta [Bacteroidota bacterium]MCY4205794.1 dehydrogenase E1 component subunit alpha/beta [Bacteroidota bacterium]
MDSIPLDTTISDIGSTEPIGNGHHSAAHEENRLIDIDENCYGEGLDVELIHPANFDPATLVHALHTMYTARLLDRKMLSLLKQGKGFFHVGCSGHEAAQTAIGLLSKPGYDWFCPYYRDLALALALGQTIEETLLDHLAKSDSVNSGGRQMPAHYGARDKNILTVCSSVGSQFLPALGLTMASMKRGSDAFTLCSAGDGATSQGAFHEALNWAARSKAPILFLIQDNKYAISVPVTDQTAGGTPYKLAGGYEGLARFRVDGTDFFKVYSVAKAAIAHLRQGKGPVCLVADVVRLLPHSSSDNHLKYRSEEELIQDQMIDPITRLEHALIEAEIITASDSEKLQETIMDEINETVSLVEQRDDPDPESAVTHVFFEGDLDLQYHSSEPDGEPVVMVDAINHGLHEEMARDESILVYGEDVAGQKGGVFTATRGLTEKFGTGRCFNSPLAEASIIGTAMGLSASGFKPVVEIQFADYIWPAMQHLRNQVATLRYRSNNAWSCPMVIRIPCGGYIHGGLCHSQNIETIFSHTPGFNVVMPSSAADAKGLLKTAIRSNDPVIFLEHKALYRAASARGPEPDEEYLIPLGKAHTSREGTDLTIITYGFLVHKCLAAARKLSREDQISAEVIDLRTLMPLDSEAVFNSVRKTHRLLVVHEDHEFLGYGAEIAAQASDIFFSELDAPVRRVGSKFSYVPFAATLEREVLPQEEDILSAARSLATW